MGILFLKKVLDLKFTPRVTIRVRGDVFDNKRSE